MDLSMPENSYIFGFIQADGHMQKNTRNRGKIIIEVNSNDSYILENIAALIPYNSSITHRIRNTNFKKQAKSSTLSFFNLELRNKFEELGLLYGKKSMSIKPPNSHFIEKDYFRGLIDADGSLGLTAKNFPFISLTTQSDDIANAFYHS